MSLIEEYFNPEDLGQNLTFKDDVQPHEARQKGSLSPKKSEIPFIMEVSKN